jgi:hypothetical protein
VPRLQGPPGNSGQRLDQVGTGIERGIPEEAQAAPLGLLTSPDVDVVEDLEVVGEELDGATSTARPPWAAIVGIRSAKSGFIHSPGSWPALCQQNVQSASASPAFAATAKAVARSWAW